MQYNVVNSVLRSTVIGSVLLKVGKLFQDSVFALRTLARNPGFTGIAVLALALAIGANTAMFSIVDGVLLRALPFHNPDRLYIIWQKSSSVPQLSISELDVNDYRSRSHSFEALGGFTKPGIKSMILSGAGDPLEIQPSFITQNFYPLLGVAPFLGRNFLPEEDTRGRNNVAILSYSFWQSRFGADPEILRRQITLDNQAFQVVGVMGPDAYPAEADLFLPYTALNPEKPHARNYHELNMVGRLRPGQTGAAAQAELALISSELERQYARTNFGIGTDVVPLREEIIGKVREPLLLLLAAVGLVLLIACGNVGNLLLVRAAARQKEIAIRVALGASRIQIISQFLIESLILSLAGAALGLLLAFFSMPLLRNLGEGRIPRLQSVEINGQILLFTLAIAIVTALLFGLIPALKYSSANLNRALRAGGRTSLSESSRLRNILVIVEVMLALVVLVSASLLVRSFNQLLQVDPGFRADHVLVAQITLPSTQYKRPDIVNFYRRLLPKIASIPGVISVATTTGLPLGATVTQTRFAVQGAPPPEPGRYPVTTLAFISPGYFQTMRIPVLRGRPFRAEDSDLDDPRCIVNATLARRFFGSQEPLGRNILMNVAAPAPDPCQIIGVVGDTRVAGLDAPAQPALYLASEAARETLVVRTATDPMAAARAIQKRVAQADPGQPLSNIRPMDEVLARSLSRRRFSATLLVLFSIVGLLLASVGLYGVVSYSVAQRTQEIGVRMALGARPGDIFKLIMSEGLLLTAIGLVCGTIAAAAATRLLAGLLFGIGSADPLSFGAGCLLLLAVSALACFIPARRATQVDPLVALRYE